MNVSRPLTYILLIYFLVQQAVTLIYKKNRVEKLMSDLIKIISDSHAIVYSMDVLLDDT